MDNLIDLSIIIPCHNLENYITPLLESFQNQKYDNINVEFIFCLDACKDNTKEVIENGMNGLNYYLYECEYYSAGEARNLGFKNSKGKYIWYIDGDDWLLSNRAFYDIIFEMKKHNHKVIKIKWLSNFYHIQCNFMVWQYIFERDFIKDIKFKQIQPHEDREFYYEFSRKIADNQMPISNDPLYYYNYNRPNSNTTIWRTYNTTEVSKILKQIDNFQ